MFDVWCNDVESDFKVGSEPINMGFKVRSYWGGYYYYSYELSQLSRSSEIAQGINLSSFDGQTYKIPSPNYRMDEVGERSPIIILR